MSSRQLGGGQWAIASGWAWVVRLVVVLLALGASAAGARTVLELDVNRQPVELLDWGDAWIDETGQATPEQVAGDPAIHWEATQPNGIYRLRDGKPLWIRFTVPPAPDMERWYVEIPYAAVNRVTLYTADSLGAWTAQVAGDTVAVADWPVPNRHPLLPVQVSAEVPRKYLLKVENPHSFSAPVMFVSDSHISRQAQRASLVLGMYFGLAALAALVAAVWAVPLRDPAYAWYALMVVLMALTQAAMTGIGGLHLWPRSPWWADMSVLLLPVAAVGAMQAFVSSVLSLQQRSVFFHRLLMGVSALSIVVAAVVLLVEPSSRFLVVAPYVVCGMFFATVAPLWAARRGDRFALGIFLGNLPVIIGAMFPLLRLLGVVPVSFLTMHGMQLGLAIELPVLLVILMLRSQQRRENLRRLQGLDRIDPATGLINAAVFHERLARLVARSVRLRHRSAVLLIDIGNLDAIRRDFGRAAADELPLRVAGRLLRGARDIDSVARLSEHRFGMLLEGPLRATEVAEAGPSVVARCLMPFENRPLEWVAHARVAQALIPLDGADGDELVARLEVLLASVPEDSKRAVFHLGKSTPPPGPAPRAEPAPS